MNTTVTVPDKRLKLIVVIRSPNPQVKASNPSLERNFLQNDFVTGIRINRHYIQPIVALAVELGFQAHKLVSGTFFCLHDPYCIGHTVEVLGNRISFSCKFATSSKPCPFGRIGIVEVIHNVRLIVHRPALSRERRHTQGEQKDKARDD